MSPETQVLSWHFLTTLNGLAWVVMIGGRAYRVIVDGGGLKEIFHSIIYGKPMPPKSP